jgi:outer membrane lipoprotein
MRTLIVLAPLVLLTACATAPAPLKGEFSALKPADSLKGSHNGTQVRWGGEIIRVDPGASTTCFEVLSRDLDASARPMMRHDTSDGRFIACRNGFYDPEVFLKGRELTVVGRVDGSERGRVGEFEYTYPRVAADAIYLWPKRPIVVEQRGWGYDPFWGPGFGPYWGGGFWGSHWHQPPVVIVKPRPTPPPKDK